MGFFKNKNTQNMSERQKLTSRYNNARHNILLVVAFTVINSVLLFIGSDSYFLFSAAIPYYLVMYGLYFTGRLPADWYEGVDADLVSDPDSVLYVFVAIAIIIVAFYALTWFLSKKHGYGWLIATLLLFLADTFAMFTLTGFAPDMIFDYVFHIWVIVSLVSGIIAVINLKKLPEEQPFVVQEGQTYSYIPQTEMPIENNMNYTPVETNVEETENTQEINE